METKETLIHVCEPRIYQPSTSSAAEDGSQESGEGKKVVINVSDYSNS